MNDGSRRTYSFCLSYKVQPNTVALSKTVSTSPLLTNRVLTKRIPTISRAVEALHNDKFYDRISGRTKGAQRTDCMERWMLRVCVLCFITHSPTDYCFRIGLCIEHCTHLQWKYRDVDSLLLPLNACRKKTSYLAWECEHERHAYEKCVYLFLATKRHGNNAMTLGANMTSECIAQSLSFSM